MAKKLLLASFVPKEQLKYAIAKIATKLNLEHNQIFVFEILDDSCQYLITYNIDGEFANLKFDSFWKDTISIHRKHLTNTLFSINAINHLTLQGGKSAKFQKIDWEKYKNTFLIYRKNELHILKIKKINIQF
jgi:hypothetical protein